MWLKEEARTLAYWLRRLVRFGEHTTNESGTMSGQTMSTDVTLRIGIDNGTVQVRAFDLMDHEHEGDYQNVDDLPETLKEKMALLDMIKDFKELEGVGRKIGDSIYWVYYGGNT